jgi:nucleolar protein 58
MARMVATKAALSIRVDALSDADSRSDPQAAEIGITNRVKLESRLRALEHQLGIQSVRRVTIGQNGRQQPKFDMSGATSSYNAATDSVKLESETGMLPTQPQPAVNKAVQAVLPVKEEKREEKREEREGKKDKKRRKSEAADVSMEAGGTDTPAVTGETKEERRARKEAKRAVCSFLHELVTQLVTLG